MLQNLQYAHFRKANVSYIVENKSNKWSALRCEHLPANDSSRQPQESKFDQIGKLII